MILNMETHRQVENKQNQPDEAATHLAAVQAQITQAEHRFHRPPGSVVLLAVSKAKPAAAIRAVAAAGQRCFGENYLQEALQKITELSDLPLEWHFIGPIQSNKTRSIAEHFAWVHSVDRLKIAQRLSQQRPPQLPPLNICLQVNISAETSKSGLTADAVAPVAKQVLGLSGLRLRGLMAIPAPSDDVAEQRQAFAQLRQLQEQLCHDGIALDTLSMGMSADMEAAIAEGATIVRVGTAIFGARQT